MVSGEYLSGEYYAIGILLFGWGKYPSLERLPLLFQEHFLILMMILIRFVLWMRVDTKCRDRHMPGHHES